MSVPSVLTKLEIPETAQLARVRRVLESLDAGLTPDDGLSARQLGYAFQTARALGYLTNGSAPQLTPSARTLLGTVVGSAEERAELRRAISACELVQEAIPN